jgi:hypothetical protein
VRGHGFSRGRTDQMIGFFTVAAEPTKFPVRVAEEDRVALLRRWVFLGGETRHLRREQEEGQSAFA